MLAYSAAIMFVWLFLPIIPTHGYPIASIHGKLYGNKGAVN